MWDNAWEKGCGVTDGCTIQVTSRMRGGGRNKDKKSKVEKKQVTRQEPVKNEGPAILESDKDAVVRMLKETEEYRKIVEDVSGGSDIEVERKMQYWGVDKGQMRVMECGLTWAVEARRKGRREEQEQRKSNGGMTSKSKVVSKRQGNGNRRRSTDKCDRENKGRTQNRSKASKCVSVKKIN